MEFNLPVKLSRFARIAELMGEKVENLSLGDKAYRAVEEARQLSIDVGMPQRMRDVGVKEGDIPGFVENVLAFQPHVVDGNPRDASGDDIRKIFEAAW